MAATNVFTLSPFKTWDPEMGGGNGLKYPLQRTFKIGVQFHY
jgi:tonB-dependent receptor plug domain protein